MTTGEKLSALRRKKGITQEQLSVLLKVSRQSVSRWEMDVSFPETEKLIKLSRLLDCSIDFLLNDDMQEYRKEDTELSAGDCFRFIRECGYFFLATSDGLIPHVRPMGIIFSDQESLYIATDKRKKVYEELMKNPFVEIAAYNLNTRRWIRISGQAETESSVRVKEEMAALYPMITQEYIGQDEIFSVIFRVLIEKADIE